MGYLLFFRLSKHKQKMAARRRRTTRRVSRKRRTTRKRRVVSRRHKARRVSVRGSRAQVWNGTRAKVKTTGQSKSELMKNKRGKIVSKKANAAGKRVYKRNGLGKWTKAFMQARKNLNLKGFVACKKGTKFYKEAIAFTKPKLFVCFSHQQLLCIL